METEPKGKSKPTPVNWRVVLVSFVNLIAVATTVSMVFPFLPWMIRKFKINGEFIQSEDTGYYAGLVASSYFIGQFMTCYFWGILSDKKSRRLTILSSGAAVAAFTLMFAFTNTKTGLAWALATRGLSGASNGVLGATKATIADVSDDTNQAKGMTFIAAAWGVGLVIGPALGGLLAEPVRQYPDTFSGNGFLETFPYFLPSAVTASLVLFGVVLVYFFLPETLEKRDAAYNLLQEETSVRYRSEGEDEATVSIERIKDNDVETETNARDIELEPVVSSRGGKKSNGMWMRFRGLRRRASRASATALKKSTWWSILKSYDSRMAIATYCTIGFASIGFDELLTLWMATKRFRGGLGFSEKEIGIYQAVISVVQTPLQIFFVHRLEKRLGSLRAYYVTCIILAFFTALQPTLTSIENDYLLWTSLFTTSVILRFCLGADFIMIFLFVNNSVPNHYVGAINGIGISLSSLARTVAPSFAGSVFAWSISDDASHLGFPLDYHLTFFLLSFIYLISLLLSVNLPSSLQKQKEE
ncbi:uncharacterized protein [Oscarella lobularis]|uniref:uncharacterized protein n=1 Tax=Oscarella lobularis TaxID=121494 RepID=UPI0033136508